MVLIELLTCGKMLRHMKNIINGKGSGFIKLIIIIIIALLLMRYFHITITGILDYFHLTWADIMNYIQQALNWLKDLFNSVK